MFIIFIYTFLTDYLAGRQKKNSEPKTKPIVEYFDNETELKVYPKRQSLETEYRVTSSMRSKYIHRLVWYLFVVFVIYARDRREMNFTT